MGVLIIDGPDEPDGVKSDGKMSGRPLLTRLREIVRALRSTGHSAANRMEGANRMVGSDKLDQRTKRGGDSRVVQ